jgi:hypothetical protein
MLVFNFLNKSIFCAKVGIFIKTIPILINATFPSFLRKFVSLNTSFQKITHHNIVDILFMAVIILAGQKI